MSNRKKRRPAEGQVSPAGAGLSAPADELAEVGLPEEDGPEEVIENASDDVPVGQPGPGAADPVPLAVEAGMSVEPTAAAVEVPQSVLPLGLVRCRARTTVAIRGAKDAAGNNLSRVREGGVCHVPLGAYEKSKEHLERL